MPADVDLREIMGCTCLRLRKTTRRVTQVFDRCLAPCGITSSQFGLLVNLAWLRTSGSNGLPIRVLAENMGLDPTTLSRTLKPLVERSLLVLIGNPADKRVRAVQITDAGRAKIVEALPHWRRAQARLDEAVSTEAQLALNGLLELTFARLPPA
jgi:DNA-binding MarR family transcriptional regulator